MTGPRDLHLYVVPPGCGGSFAVRRHGGYVLVEPLFAEASEWLKSSVSEDTNWAGEHLFIEPRYFPHIAKAIIEAGFLFEVDEGPSAVPH